MQRVALIVVLGFSANFASAALLEPPGDFDGDRLVADEDFALLLPCVQGPDVPLGGCVGDLDADDDADMCDFAAWALDWYLADCTMIANGSQQGDGPLYHAFNAIDGLSSTRWSSAFADNQPLTIDCGYRRPIEAISIEWEDAYAATYSVLVSDDLIDWEQVYRTTSGNGGTDIILTPGLRTRFVQILCEVRALPYGSSIWEVRFDSPIRCYHDPRPVETRIDELVAAMTLNEKVSLCYGEMAMSLPAVPRLRIPALQLADGPLGIRWDTSTAFPAPIALASSWDVDLARRFGEAMGKEFRNKGRQVWLGPAFNIIRIPQNGRNFEYFSEDPFLAGSMAVATVQGAQSQGVVACVKHFAANNQEQNRTSVNVQVDERTLREIYLRAFEMAVRQGGALAIMSAYNRLNGPYCTANAWLQTDVLKDDWGFEGFVVSDWGAVHETVAPALAGLDLEMDGASPTGAYWSNGQLLGAVQGGQVSVALLEDKVRRILRAIFATGIMDEKWDSPDVELVEHRALVREIAAKGAVLLKNENDVLPLSRAGNPTIAVLGPNYSVARTGGGGSSGVTPTYSVSPLQGLKNVAPGVTFVDFVGTSTNPPPALTSWLTPSQGGGNGLYGQYYNNQSLSGSPAMARVDGDVNFDWGSGNPGGGLGDDNYSVRWSGTLTVPTSGSWAVGMATDDGFRMYIDGQLEIDDWNDHGEQTTTVPLQLVAGQPVNVVLEYYEAGGAAVARFVAKVNDLAAAVNAAQTSDAALIFVGTDSSKESEGFDRSTIDLTAGEIQLIQSVNAVQPNTVVVVVAGSQVGFDAWIDATPAIVQAWYGGQEAGNAIADVLFGDVNPGGKLPMSFVRDYSDHPAAGLYPSGVYSDGLAVGYRYFDVASAQPAFPFGHGLSYTTFAYSNLTLDTSQLAIDGTLGVSFEIENTGSVTGSEVAQVYVRDIGSSVPRPFKELKGFDKVTLAPGECTTVTITLDDRAFAFYDTTLPGWKIEPGQFYIYIGASAEDVRLSGTFIHP